MIRRASLRNRSAPLIENLLEAAGEKINHGRISDALGSAGPDLNRNDIADPGLFDGFADRIQITAAHGDSVFRVHGRSPVKPGSSEMPEQLSEAARGVNAELPAERGIEFSEDIAALHGGTAVPVHA